MSEKVDKMESKLETLSEQQMKMMSEQTQLIESIKAALDKLEKKERNEQPPMTTTKSLWILNVIWVKNIFVCLLIDLM